MVICTDAFQNCRKWTAPAKRSHSDEQEPGVLVPGLPPPQKYLRNYQSVPQPGLGGRSSSVASGAVVGGGTIVNAMFFHRGSAVDYDSWEKLGNPGWSWKDLRPYFKKVSLTIAFTTFEADVRPWPLEHNIHATSRRFSGAIPYIN